MNGADELRLHTEVLVLGTGGAGLRAALAARRAGAKVLVVSKMQAEDPNCTAAAWGGTTYATPAHETELFRQVVHTGGFLSNQRLVEAFVHGVPESIANLVDCEVPLDILDHADTEGRLGVARVRGGNGPRGFGLVRPLRRRAMEAGVEFVDELMVASLLVSDGRVGGALGVQLCDGTPVVITAQAVIIACGGGACLFERTDNPPGTTGDGIALAYHAGAELVDLELVSFQFPTRRIAEAFAAPGVPAEKLAQMAKLGVAISEWMEAHELDATAIQCWTSLQRNFGCNACTLMSVMSEKFLPSACEVDVTGVLTMYAMQLASGTPAALVDWNNNYADDENKCVLFHCGNWAKAFLPDIRISNAPILGSTLGVENTYGALEGRTGPGPLTFGRITTADAEGAIRAYVGEGELTADELNTWSLTACPWYQPSPMSAASSKVSNLVYTVPEALSVRVSVPFDSTVTARCSFSMERSLVIRLGVSG